MKKWLLTIALILMWSPAFATDRTAASCSRTAVGTVVSAADAGDTIIIPAGTCTWSSSLEISKPLTIRGSSTKTTDGTIINESGSPWLFDVKIAFDIDTYIEISGITLNGTSSSSNASIRVRPVIPYFTGNIKYDVGAMVTYSGYYYRCKTAHTSNAYAIFDATKWTTSSAGALKGPTGRIHDMRLLNFTVSRRFMWVEGYSKGVVDSCYIQNATSIIQQGVPEWAKTTPWMSSASCPTCGADNWFFEDITWDIFSGQDGVIDCQNGGHYVFRYNTVSVKASATVLGTIAYNHGFETESLPRSCVGMEIYKNIMSTATSTSSAIDFRGGSGTIYNNRLSGAFGYPIKIFNYRDCPQWIQEGHTATFGLCNGTQKWDGNTGTGADIGYPCRDQVGTTRPDVSNVDYHWVPTYEPLYAWDNCYGTSLSDVCVDSSSNHRDPVNSWYDSDTHSNYTHPKVSYPHYADPTHIYEGRDVIVDIDKTLYPAWVTGTYYKVGKLITWGGAYYRCITGHTASANIASDSGKWVGVQKYQAYTYPHPLRGAPSPDTTPPVRSDPYPTSDIVCPSAGLGDSAQATIGITTNEPATCRFGITAGVAYASQPLTMTTSDSYHHSYQIEKGCNETWTYYVKCQDTATIPNANTDDVTIVAHFLPNGNPDTTPPAISSPLPTGTVGCTSASISTIIQATVTDATGVDSCRYDTTNKAYASMSAGNSLSGSGSTYSATVTNACDSSYNYYIACKDTSVAANANGTDTTGHVAYATGSLITGKIEAESGSLTSPMESTADDLASGGYYVSSNTASSGNVAIPVTITTPGTYSIYGRVLALDEGADSFYMQVDSLPIITWYLGLDSIYNTWKNMAVNDLSAAYTVELTAGAHTITFYTREQFARLDYIYLVLESTPDTEDPVVNFVLPTTNRSKVVSTVKAFEGTHDNVGVTGYCVTTSDGAGEPAATCGAYTTWSSTPPLYNATASGALTLYGWSCDGAGNINDTGVSSSTTIIGNTSIAVDKGTATLGSTAKINLN